MKMSKREEALLRLDELAQQLRRPSKKLSSTA
jgi:hypothetical protein